MWKPTLRDRLVEILPYCIVASSIAFGAIVEEYTEIGFRFWGLSLLLVLIWFILVDKTDLLGGDYPLDEDWPLGHLWKLFLLSGGVLLWSGLIIAGIGALIKSEVVKAIGSMMGYGGIIGGVVNGLFIMLVLLILSLFISKK